MAARTVAVRLTAEVGSYVAGMKNAASATKDLTNSTLDTAKKNKQAFQQIGVGAAAIGTVAAAGVYKAVSSFADFQAAMSGVEAATHASAGAMKDLEAAALEAGARTSFSATEAAAGIDALAKAGISTEAILNGGLNGALDLAAAGGLAVGDAAEIAATAMTQFGLAGGKVPHVADLLAAAAGKAQGDVSDMGMALKQAGLVASQTGLSIEETTAGLASFASAGLLGSDAGTSFKAMLQRLTPQSAEAAGLMEKLGISAYDAQGQFVGLEAFAGNLQDSLKGLTVEQRNSAMATIFGSDAVRAAAVLYDQGAAGVAAWTDKVNDAGYAQETAAIKLDNLKGDFEALSGSIETALIKTGAAGDGLARGAVQGVTKLVNAYSDLPPTAQAATLAVGSVTAVAGGAASAFLLLAPRIAETRDALRTLNTEMPRTTAAMKNLAKVAGIATVLAGTAVAIDMLSDKLAGTPPGVNALTDSLADFVKTGKATGDLARIVGQDFADLGDKLELASKNRLGEFLNPFGESDVLIKKAREEIEALDQALAGMVSSGNAAQAGQTLASMATATGMSLDELKARLPSYAEALAGTSAQTKLAADAQGQMGGAVGAATGEIQTQAEKMSELMGQIRSLSDMILGLRGSEREFEASVDAATESLKENGRTLDIGTEKGRANSAALDSIAAAANDVNTALVEAGTPMDQVSAKMKVQRDRLIQAAIGFGMTRGQANAYADSVLRIPSKAQTTIALNGVESAIGRAAAFRQAIANIPSMKNVTVRYNEVQGVTVRRGNTPGQVLERASGGWISGPGTATSDSIPARLSNGEFVVNARSAQQNAALLEAINGQRFAAGGWVSGRASSAAAAVPALPSTLVLNVGGRSFTAYVDEIATNRANGAVAKIGREAATRMGPS